MNSATNDISDPVTVRDAAEADLDGLQALSGTRVMHADRIRESRLGWMQYLVAEVRGRVAGFGLLMYSVPPDWDRPEHVPVVVNLHVRADCRSRGIGSAILREMEARSRRRNFAAIYLRVEPENNPRAFALYKRLGFEPLQDKPFLDPYRFVDSDGTVHQGVEWNVEMVKWLNDGRQGSGDRGQ
jgi:ribosomal protein S18 acetylase RimI-like enzyme